MGIVYFVAQFISIFVTKNAYKLEKYIKGNLIITMMWLGTSITLIVLGVFSHNFYIVIISFILFYVYQNIRKPYMVEKLGNNSQNDKRASILSIESQITSLIIIVIAPLLGFVSDYFGIGIMLISIGVMMLIIEFIYYNRNTIKDKKGHIR